MRKRLRIISKTTVLLILIGIGFTACFEPEEACLDSNAANFDVYADENCCCVYPSLNVNIIKQVNGVQYNTSALLLADTFTNSFGQRYQIAAQSFYISNIVITYEDGATSQVLDTLELTIPLDSGVDVVIEDNFGLVRQSSASYRAGLIQENGSIAQLDFMVGLTDQINMVVPDQLPTSHALGATNAADHYVEGSGYVYIRWNIKPIDVAGVEEISVILSGSTAAQLISLDASLVTDPATSTKVPFVAAPGTPTEVPLIVDYGKWLEGIDFAADQSDIDAKIIENTSSAFSIF